MRTEIKRKLHNCYLLPFSYLQFSTDKPVKDLHADNSLAITATDRISSTRYVTTKQYHNRIILQTTENNLKKVTKRNKIYHNT